MNRLVVLVGKNPRQVAGLFSLSRSCHAAGSCRNTLGRSVSALEPNVVRLAVLADEGVELSLAVEIIQEVPHQSGRSRIDDQLTPLMLDAPSLDKHHQIRISFPDRPANAGEIRAWGVGSEHIPAPLCASGCTFLIR
jgi:hypothetical protein